MSQAVVQNAALHASSPVVDAEIPTAAAVTIGIALHDKCTRPPAQVAAMRPKCLSSRAMIDPSIAVIVSSRSAQLVAVAIRTVIAMVALVGREGVAVVTTANLAGKIL